MISGILHLNHNLNHLSEKYSFITSEHNKSPFGQMENFPFAIPIVEAKLRHALFQSLYFKYFIGLSLKGSHKKCIDTDIRQKGMEN